MSDSEPPSEETELHPVALAPRFRSVVRVRWSDSSGPHDVPVSGRMVVGSAAGSGIVIQDSTVSRLHAELDARDDGLWVRDLGSRNGTFVDGLQVTGARLPNGSTLRLGALDFTVEYSTAEKTAVELWRDATFGQLVGRSVGMRELFAILSRVAPMDASVLIHGETGTGKELVARAIHDASNRALKPFVVVDCAALPENLLDAELFGHSKGAFTGAAGAREGSIEAADGGTVFLDEIGELPPAMQPKLLRVLESRMVRRIGETSYRNVDVRFISATHRDLPRMVSAGEFREDLYFRLSVLPVSVPPLRERKDDIEMLVNHFLHHFGDPGNASADLIREIANRPWRGNVRELRNFVERARALGTQQALRMLGSPNAPLSATLEAAPSAPLPAAPAGPHADVSDPAMFERAYKEFRESWIDAGEREYVRRLLLRHGHNVQSAAREAGIDRTYIYRLIRKHSLA
jgi:two-component system, NtrC family, response regulator GlrR